MIILCAKYREFVNEVLKIYESRGKAIVEHKIILVAAVLITAVLLRELKNTEVRDERGYYILCKLGLQSNKMQKEPSKCKT